MLNLLAQLQVFHPKEFSAYPSKLIVYHKSDLSQDLLNQFNKTTPLPYLSVDCRKYDLFCARQNISTNLQAFLYIKKEIIELQVNDKLFATAEQFYQNSPKNFFERFADKSLEYNQVQLSMMIGTTVTLIFGPLFYFYARYFGTKRPQIQVESFEEKQQRHKEYFQQEREMMKQGVKMDLMECFVNKNIDQNIKKNE